MKNLKTNTALFGSIKAKDANGLHLQDDGGNGMFIKDGGNVGIGTTDPVYNLHLANSSSANFLIQRTTPGGQVDGITLNSVSGSGINNRTGDISLTMGAGAGDSEPVLRFSTTNSPSATKHTMFITNGNVGIGTTSPNTNLHVTSASGNGDGTVFVENTSATYGMGLKVKGGGNADNERFALRVQSAAGDDILFAQSKTGNVGIGTTNPATLLHINQGSASAYATLLLTTTTESFSVGVGGTSASLAGLQDKLYIHDNTHNTTRLVIDSTGNVGIATANPNFPLHVNGRIEVDSDDVVINDGGVYIGSSSGQNRISNESTGLTSTPLYIGNASIQVSSDRRIKKNIEDSKVNATSVIKKLRIVDFDWDDPSDNCLNNRNARGRWTGLIAQEAIEHFPTLVNAPRKAEDLSIDMESESIWHLDQAAAIPMLIKAIQEQQSIIEDLKSQNESLVARIEALEG